MGAVADVLGGYDGPGSGVMSSFSGWGPRDDIQCEATYSLCVLAFAYTGSFIAASVVWHGCLHSLR